MIKLYFLLMILFLIGCGNNTKSKDQTPANSKIRLNDVTQGIIVQDVPKIDGNINNDEWHLSRKEVLKGGDSIFFHDVNDTLYVAIRGTSGGFTSMGIASQDKIKIFHASTGLITAEYIKDNSFWKLLYDFKEPLKAFGEKYPRNQERLTEDYRKSQLTQFGWYANLIEMGKPSETEFLIPLSALPEGANYFALVFYQVKSREKIAKFPKKLNDAMLNQELISGSAVDSLKFNIESWQLLSEILK